MFRAQTIIGPKGPIFLTCNPLRFNKYSIVIIGDSTCRYELEEELMHSVRVLHLI